MTERSTAPPPPFHTRRLVPHAPARLFQAFAQPERLAHWWGPAGFSNTFETFEFRPGGRWKYVMHGPDGKSYPNESVFDALDEPSRVVIRHVSLPRYVLTITLTGRDGGTEVDWNQQFEDPVAAARLRHIVEPANEQNLDRLGELLEAGPGSG